MNRIDDDLTNSIEMVSDYLDKALIAEIMEEHKGNIMRWSRLARFEVEAYCRTPVFKCSEFEIVVVGWMPGQFTPIHDHAGSFGAVMVLKGECVEEYYFTNTLGKASLLEAATHRKGEISIVDQSTVHRVGNSLASKIRCITAHIYAPPLGTMGIYEEELTANA